MTTDDALRRQAEAVAVQRMVPVRDDLPALSPEEMRQALHELQVHQIELEMQNEELRRVQGELEASRSRYFELYDLAPVGYLTLSARGLIVEANLAVAMMLGLDRSALVHIPLTRFVFSDDQALYYRYHRQVSAASAPQACELRMLASDGTTFWARLTATVVSAAEGAPTLRVVLVDISLLKQATAAVVASEERFRDITEHAQEWVWEVDADGRYTYTSGVGEKMLGYTSEEILQRHFYDLFHPDDRESLKAAALAGFAAKRPFRGLISRNLHKDGHIVWLTTSAVPLLSATGELVGYRGVDSDITERKQAEDEKAMMQARLVEAQKLESVGRLAGGVAHDFNNLLMGIMNYVELCRDELPPQHPACAYLDEITADAWRSANITKQLLGFARKQVISPKVMDVNDALAGMAKMLRHLMGEDIALTWMPGLNLWPIKVDSAQLGQILANLCVNARDAIAGVGNVRIETANLTLAPADCAKHAGTPPGEYVRLAVSDSGCGMSEEVLEHLFEPFFTTKEVGKGTGLGLATVYGIVEQNHGHIEVHSEVGKGTTFSILLPRVAWEAEAEPAAEIPVELPRGTETILLAEDEKSVRVTARLFLEALGYTVLAAETPEEAVRLAGTHRGRIHLLVTDVIMPGMNGPHLAGLLTKECPNLKCLFMSGYTAEVMAHRGTLDAGMPFMSKPFTRGDLARKVRAALDGE